LRAPTEVVAPADVEVEERDLADYDRLFGMTG